MKKKTMQNNPMQQELKITCFAKTRSGHPCKTAPVKGKKRCRMHGGAKGSGAPKGSKNALKHGYYTKDNIAKRSEVHKLIKNCRKLSQELEGDY